VDSHFGKAFNKCVLNSSQFPVVYKMALQLKPTRHKIASNKFAFIVFENFRSIGHQEFTGKAI